MCWQCRRSSYHVFDWLWHTSSSSSSFSVHHHHLAYIIIIIIIIIWCTCSMYSDSSFFMFKWIIVLSFFIRIYEFSFEGCDDEDWEDCEDNMSDDSASSSGDAKDCPMVTDCPDNSKVCFEIFKAFIIILTHSPINFVFSLHDTSYIHPLGIGCIQTCCA